MLLPVELTLGTVVVDLSAKIITITYIIKHAPTRWVKIKVNNNNKYTFKVFSFYLQL